MNLIKILLIATMLLLGKNMGYAAGYTYEKREIDKHIIHIVVINPKDYAIELVKAGKGVNNGRETVPSMAMRHHAEIAINGGFFNIGEKDGTPSGTLVINGHKYNLKNQIQSLLVIDSGTLSILRANPKDYLVANVTMVSGIPLLIKDSEISKDISKKNGEFYINPHARTALGIKPDGTIVIVVAEHNYRSDLISITIGVIKSLLKEKIVPQYRSLGLTILELAELMKQLGCLDAINLDGGGSATLWIKDKVVNQTVGDKDEANGVQAVRAVSDAIIFKRL